MRIAELLLPEFDHEMATTRRVSERVPDDKFGWRAYPKSNTLGWNVSHLAEIPGWVVGTIHQTAWDLAPVGQEPYRTPAYECGSDALHAFDENVLSARNALNEVEDDTLHAQLSLLMPGEPLFIMSRYSVIRTWVISHVVHHRAHVCVYLRLNDIPVPSIYGPSGDESGAE